MKHFKRLFSYLVALTMVLSLAAFAGVNVHAEDSNSYKITLNNAPEGRTYKAYQIFKGDYSKGTLSNIEWGNGITATTLVSKLKGDSNFSGITDNSTARDVAEKLSSAGNDSTQAKAFAKDAEASVDEAKGIASSREKNVTSISVTECGYYLIKDTTPADDQSEKTESYTRYIVKVVGADTNVDLKGNVPTVTKKVKDINDSTDTTTGNWQDSADYDIGDTVPYQITGTMPSNISDYTSYKYIFTDTMSKGLSYNGTPKTAEKDAERGNATITIGDKNVTNSFTENVEYLKDKQGKETGETKVTWSCGDLTKVGVTLTANTKVVVTYKCTLNSNAVIGSAGNPNTVDLTYSNNPNKGGEGETGKTPKDTNIVFTYKTVVNKVDQNSQPLTGADFTLYKFVENSDGDKTYTDKDNKEHKGTWVDVTALHNGDNKVRKVVSNVNDKKNAKFSFEGIDDGYYMLKETKTPSGYNTIADQYFTVEAVHDTDSKDPKLTSLSGNVVTGNADTIEMTPDKNAGSLTTNVVNKSGSTLPSTGGMGTTLLYAAGGILVACAVAYVVLNKKHAK